MNFAERESLTLAPYAMHAADSAGRAVAEPDHSYRSPYQRDRDRITHSAAFRRLSHKTQVFTRELGGAGGDYHRSRLTHTLEVASIARTLARALGLNEDLVEALALAHDVGHPPFGHAGEAVLNDELRGEGGFNHNDQAVRIFTRLERRYPDRPGLNLSAEVLEGQVSRGGKSPRTVDAPRSSSDASDGMLLEVQIVDAADSIAYDSHDADDALEMGLLDPADLEPLALWTESAARVRRRYAALSEADFRRATVHELIDRQVSDLLAVTRSAIKSLSIDSVDAVRAAGAVARHSVDLEEQRHQLEAFLFRRVYRHPQVLEHRERATTALRTRFERLLAHPELMPPDRAADADETPRRVVADYLASLTDRAALEGTESV